MMDGENAKCIVQYDWIVQITKIKKKKERQIVIYPLHVNQ